MTWLWQPLLPGGAQLLSGAGATSGAFASDGAATVAFVGAAAVVGNFAISGTSTAAFVSEATAASSFAISGSASVSWVALDAGAPPIGGGDHVYKDGRNRHGGSRSGRKTLPYGWWNTPEEAREELAQATQAIAEARKEVKALGEVRPGTLDDLRRTLAFAEVERGLAALEAAATKAKANKELTAMAAEVERERARLAEIEDEEDIEFLLANLI